MSHHEGYAIVPPVSPWDEKHRALIELEHAKSTFGKTPAEAWARQIRRGEDSVPPHEAGRLTQAYVNRGYRLRNVTFIIHEEGK